MNQYFLYLIFFLIPFSGFSQGNIKSEKTIIQPSENERWGLDQYVWSYAKYKTDKNKKPAIDYDAMSSWMKFARGNDVQISPNGKYFAYGIKKVYSELQTLDTLVVQSTDNSWRQTFINTMAGFFSDDNRQYIYYNEYQSKLGIVNLDQRTISYREDVKAGKFPPNKKNEWLAFRLKNNSPTVVLQDLRNSQEKRFDSVLNYSFDPSSQWFVCDIRSTGNPGAKDVFLYNLNEKKEFRFTNISGYVFASSGNAIVLNTLERSNGEAVSVLKYFNLSDGSTYAIWTTSDNSHNVSSQGLDVTGKQVVFIVDQKGTKSIWYWKEGMVKAKSIVTNQGGIDPEILITGQPRFADNGRYLLFQFQPPSDKRKPEPNSIAVDVWSHQDVVLQSTQVELFKEPESYTAVFNLDNGKLFQLESTRKKLLEYNKVYGDYAVITQSGSSLHGHRFWERDYYYDSCWVVSLTNGSSKYVGRAHRSSEFSVSPKGDYLVFADCDKKYSYFSYNLHTGKLTNISGGVPADQFRYRVRYRKPMEKNAVGIAGWLEGDAGVLVYDNNDIWQLDLSGKAPAKNITNGYGEKHGIEFFFMNSRRNYACKEVFYRNDNPVVLAFNNQNKHNGFYRVVLGAEQDPELLYMGPKFFFGLSNYSLFDDKGIKPLKAADDDAWIVQRESPNEAPNYYYTRDFKEFKRLTDIQPQKEYNWITRELCSFKQLDGSIGHGVLTKPENFDSKKKYPVIIAFYGSLTDQLNQFPSPKFLDDPSPFDNPAWFASNGYLVFTPDVCFTDGQWGPSTVNVVDGAARYLSELPFVDGMHIAACGHSNSGSTGYYVLTHSFLFAAMAVGAGTSDYLSRALSLYFNKYDLDSYEVSEYKTSLGNIWKNKNSWLDHTSVLHADEATSPLLMFHCERDGNPIRQAIEMFISLERSEKKVWWLQYDHGDHTIGPVDGRDFTIRNTQFYDHYLKGAPAPRWMTSGIPFALKGIEARYEIDPSGNCGKDCAICKAWNEQHKRTPQMFTTALTEWKLDNDLKEALEKEEKRRYEVNKAKDDEKVKDIIRRLSIKKKE